MAFCRNCGAEVSDEAFVCTKCGSLINTGKKKVANTSLEDAGFHNSASFWLLFVAGIFFVISVILFNMSLNRIDVYVISYLNWGYGHPNIFYSVLSFIASFIVLVLCVISYATSFKLVKDGTISKSTNYLLLLLMISSVLYAFGQLYILMF
jgi:archaellum biogenesis protein FlaJ (TadC family)